MLSSAPLRKRKNADPHGRRFRGLEGVWCGGCTHGLPRKRPPVPLSHSGSRQDCRTRAEAPFCPLRAAALGQVKAGVVTQVPGRSLVYLCI